MSGSSEAIVLQSLELQSFPEDLPPNFKVDPLEYSTDSRPIPECGINQSGLLSKTPAEVDSLHETSDCMVSMHKMEGPGRCFCSPLPSPKLHTQHV
jgi:hypothetical protein